MQTNQDEIDFDEDWYLSRYRDVAAAVENGYFVSGLQHYRSYGRVEGRKAHGRVGKIAIITMVYNEATNLPIWIRHYSRMAPSANLFVIDHASDDGSTENLAGVTRIPMPRDRLDEIDRVFLVNGLQHGFLRYYEIVIYTDCDELLVPDPAKSSSLEAHLDRNRYAYASAVGVNVIHNLNAEAPLDVTQPLLGQRRYAHFHSQLCKPLVTRVPLTWQPGFHSSNQPLNIDQDLYLFHIKQIDRDRAMQRQQASHRLLWSRRAIEAGHWAHHRFDDDHFDRDFFLNPMAELRHSGVREFGFDAELARMREETRERSGAYHAPEFRGPIVEIPERFRAAV